MANAYKTPITVGIDTAQLKSLIDRLVSLNKTAGRTAIKKGMGEITKTVLAAAKGKVRRRSGLLAKSLGRRVVVGRSGQQITGIVKPRGGQWVTKPPDYVTQRRQRKTRSGQTQFFVQKYASVAGGKLVNPARYAHLVEFGRVAVRVKKKKVLSTGKGGAVFGKSARGVAPSPFMRPAWSENRANTVPVLHRYLSRAVVKEWLASRAKAPAAKPKR